MCTLFFCSLGLSPKSNLLGRFLSEASVHLTPFVLTPHKQGNTVRVRSVDRLLNAQCSSGGAYKTCRPVLSNRTSSCWLDMCDTQAPRFDSSHDLWFMSRAGILASRQQRSVFHPAVFHSAVFHPASRLPPSRRSQLIGCHFSSKLKWKQFVQPLLMPTLPLLMQPLLMPTFPRIHLLVANSSLPSKNTGWMKFGVCYFVPRQRPACRIPYQPTSFSSL